MTAASNGGRPAQQMVCGCARTPVTPDGFVEPDAKMALADYEAALAATRDQWQRWEE